MNNWVPTLIAIITGLAGAFSPQIQTFAAHNPELVGGIVAIGGTILHLLPSPVVKS